MATLVLARPWHFVDPDQAVAISINDKLVGRLPNQSYAYFHVLPGQVRVTGEIGVLGWPRREIEVRASPGDVHYLFWQAKDAAVHEQLNYLVLGAGRNEGEIRWEATSPEQAQAKLRSLLHVSGAIESKPPGGTDRSR
jgi:hypothetical protein